MPLALVGQAVLVQTHGATIRAVDSKNGSLLWETVLDEKPTKICGGYNSVASVRTADNRQYRISIVDGKVGRLGGVVKSGDPCARVASSDRMQQPHLVYDKSNFGPKVKVEGMSLKFAFRHVRAKRWIGVGYKSPGTRIPMLAVYQPESNETFWKSAIPESDAISYTQEVNEPYVDADRDLVVILYHKGSVSDGNYRLGAFDVESGRRLWDRAMPDAEKRYSGVSLSPTHVLAATYYGVDVLDRKTGSKAYSAGR